MMLFYNILSLLGTSHEQSQCHCHRQKESTSLSLHVTGTKSPCHCHCMSQTQSPCHCHVELPRGRGSWKDLTKELSVSTAADFSSTTSVSFSHLILFSYRKDRKKRKKKTLISPQSVQENHKVTCRTTNHTSHTTQLIKHCVTPHEQHKHNATHHMACHLTKQHHLCYTTHHMLHNLSCNKSWSKCNNPDKQETVSSSLILGKPTKLESIVACNKHAKMFSNWNKECNMLPSFLNENQAD